MLHGDPSIGSMSFGLCINTVRSTYEQRLLLRFGDYYDVFLGTLTGMFLW